MFRKSNMGPASGGVFLLLIFIHYGQCCGPAEIGKQYTITSTADVSSNEHVVWSFVYINAIAVYISSYSNPNLDPESYVGSRTQLTILHVSKVDGTGDFRHIVHGIVDYQCKLRVYKRANSPTCEPVTLTGNQIRTKCTTAEVYPQAKCEFTLQNGVTDRKNIPDGPSYITYNHTDPQPEENEYYSTSCTLQYPVDRLKPGNWTVQVNMYPDLTGVSMTQGTVGQADNTLPLTLPTVNIDPNSCPKGLSGEGDTNVENGYIRQGEQASCLCTRAHAGNPPGTIDWSSTQKGSFVILSESEDAATIQMNSPDAFTCRSTSVLNGSHSMTYTPKYAYGPNEITINLADGQLREVQNKPLILCGSEGLELTVICAVKQADIQPELELPSNDLSLNNPNGIITLETHLNFSEGVYKSVNKLKIISGGSHTLTCEARNPKVRNIKQTQSLTIEARKPPSTTPVVSALSRQNGDALVQGDDVTVSCSVYGGHPSVQSVTLACGQDQSVASNGTSTEMTLNKIGPSNSVINCMCQATHVTGCYDLMGVLPLKILSSNPYKADENTAELVGTAVGVFVGTLVLVAVIALIVFFVRRGREKRKNRTEDTEYDKMPRQPSLPYQNVRPRDPNYETMNSAEEASNNASAKQETDRTYNNQAFDDYIEPTEPEPNAYIDIQAD